MRLSLRLTFALLLWCTTLVPPVLYFVHRESPLAAMRFALGGERTLTMVGTLLLLAFLLALALYPPFFPALRLAWRRTGDRLQVDQGPMLAALADLKHFETAAKHLDVARVAARLGRLQIAVPHALRAVELDPDDLAARYLLATCLRRVGHEREAIGQLKLVVEKDPDHAFGQAQLELAHNLLLAGQNGEALPVLDRFVAEHSGNRKALFWRARCLHTLGKQPECRSSLQEAAAPPPESVRLTPEDALYRARAKVALWTWGRA